MSSLVHIQLSDGKTVLVEPTGVRGERDVSAQKSLDAQLNALLPSIISLCQDLSAAFSAAAPSKTSIQFGVAFKLETSGVVALITKANTEANFSVTLEWARAKQ